MAHGNELVTKVQTYSPAKLSWHVALSSGAAIRLISSQWRPFAVIYPSVETMAQNQGLTTFVVWAPDNTAAGTLERRLAVRPSHLDNAHQLTKEGIIRVGGGVLTSDSTNAAPADRKFFGSCIIIEAENLEAARKLIEDDIYYKSGVWDKERLQILPIALATPLPPVPLN